MTFANTALPYLDPELPIHERVQDLIARMSIEEKISQLRYDAPALPRLGIHAYNYWSEALHGVARNGRATVFPQAIGLAATWDTSLIQRIGSAIGDEGRAKHHEALRAKGGTSQYQGLTFWSPNINIFRDPRWGRGQETYGEDPYLTGEIGAAFVRGIQGEHPRYLKAAACAKHYAVHSGPEALRHGFNAQVSMRDLHDTYLPAFKKLVVEANVEAVMGAYNRTNGDPCCAHPYLIAELLRSEWGFTGHYVSDCGAVADIYLGHRAASGPAAAAALALKGGCDLECGNTYRYLDEALERGLVDEADIDLALRRIFSTRFKLGMFDPPELVPFASIPLSVVGCDDHRHLAYQAALRSIVLLKNENRILPLTPALSTIRLLGPTASDANILLGNYFGLSGTLTTILEGITDRLPEGVSLEYRQAFQLMNANTSKQDWLLEPEGQPDVAIVCMGLSPIMEGEEGEAIASTAEGDRKDISLPEVQSRFIRRLAATGVKIVLVLSGGGPVALDGIEEIVDAILFIWYPGEQGGNAVADVLFGNAAPSGRLPVTFPRSTSQLPPFADYNMSGRTYRYMTEEPLYPFGFGLTYTSFAYSNLELNNNSLKAGDTLSVQVTVSNTGLRAGEEVVQVYLCDLTASVPVPQYRLAGFQRIHLEPGENRTIFAHIPPEAMMVVNDNGQLILEPGEFSLVVGSCSPGRRSTILGAPAAISCDFKVT